MVVEFYCDGKLKHINKKHIPNIVDRLWIGLWFSSVPNNHWPGKNADWISLEMFVKRVRIILFAESYLLDHFRDITKII